MEGLKTNLPTTEPVSCIGAEPSRGGGAELARMESGCSAPNLLDCPIANYGWRRVDELPCKFGDEWLVDSNWVPFTATECGGCDGGHRYPVRRRITPPDGYEIVPLDEVPPLNCLIWDADGLRESGYGCTGLTCRKLLPKSTRNGLRAFFRPITKEEFGWIPVSVRLPLKSDYPVEVTDGYVVSATEIKNADSCQRLPGFPHSYRVTNPTHWKPLKLSSPPKPPKPAEEIAFEKWKDSTGCDPFPTLRLCWLAALEFTKEQQFKSKQEQKV